MTFAFTLVRAVHFLSLMIVFGAGAVKLLLAARGETSPGDALPRALLLGASSAALASALLWLAFAAAAMSGSGAPLFDPHTIGLAVAETRFGHVMIARLVLLVALLAGAIADAPLRLRTSLAGAALACIALTSHAAAGGSGAAMYARALNDAVHLLAAGFWLGGLCYLLPLAILHRRTPQALFAPLRRFSGWGSIAVALLISAGVLNAWLILWASNRSVSQAYETVLGIKIALAALMVSLALANRMSFLPGLRAGRDDAVRALIPSVAIELGLGILVVCAAALLGLLSPEAG